MDLAKENPLEHMRLRGAWWEILANNIMTMIVNRDIEGIAQTHAILTELQKKGQAYISSHQEDRNRLLGYLDILDSAKIHF